MDSNLILSYLCCLNASDSSVLSGGNFILKNLTSKMVGEFTWSELLLKPVEFEFGPTLANESEKPQIKYVAAKRFHANFEPQPRRNKFLT